MLTVTGSIERHFFLTQARSWLEFAFVRLGETENGLVWKLGVCGIVFKQLNALVQ